MSDIDRRTLTERVICTKLINPALESAGCPDAQWRLIVSLSRFGGLRTPSETLALRWSDVDWQESTIRAVSPKTAHHDGHGERVIPLFGELRLYLEEAFNPEDGFVVTRYRNASQNMRTQFSRIVVKAGLKPWWSQPFHAMRKSRQTELSDDFPAHTVCNWLGNSEAIAREFYLKIKEENHSRAVSRDCMRPCMQNGVSTVSNDLQPGRDGNEEPPALQGVTTNCITVLKREMDDRGLETPSDFQRKTAFSIDGAAPALQTIPNLEELIKRWSSIPPNVRDQILRLAATLVIEDEAAP